MISSSGNGALWAAGQGDPGLHGLEEGIASLHRTLMRLCLKHGFQGRQSSTKVSPGKGGQNGREEQ